LIQLVEEVEESEEASLFSEIPIELGGGSWETGNKLEIWGGTGGGGGRDFLVTTDKLTGCKYGH